MLEDYGYCECAELSPEDRLARQHQLTSLARTLRSEMTYEEKRLWYKFLRYYPVHIYKQRVIDLNYIADFYCHAARIVIELDGEVHDEPAQKRKDQLRDRRLAELGYLVLRYRNEDVDKRFKAVCADIDLKIRARVAARA